MTVYLLHFDEPLGHAHHYLGSTDDLQKRIYAHSTGRGSRLLAACSEQGITFRLVRTWEGGREQERRLKRQKNSRRFCPECRAQYLKGRSMKRSERRLLCAV